MEQLIDFHAPEVQAVLDTLLKDKSTGKNIIWATDPPEELQTVMYEPVTDRSQITTQQLGLTHYEVVLPRMMKQTDTQQQRTRKKGEVFSPAWVCNKMNNALDADWFGALGTEQTTGQFTVELPQGWQTVETPVQFPACGGKTPAWVQYVQSRRLEVTCGEAPFLASRYDAATGEMIPVARRIGILSCVLMLGSSKKFRTASVSKQLGVARLSFTTAEQLENILGLTQGSVTVTGLLNDTTHCVHVAIDRDLLNEERILIHPNINTASLVVKTSDILRFLDLLGYEFTPIAVEDADAAVHSGSLCTDKPPNVFCCKKPPCRV